MEQSRGGLEEYAESLNLTPSELLALLEDAINQPG